jgi:thiamine biosynthesis lipoprotein
MGTSISVLIGPPAGPALLPAGAMVIAAQAMLVRFERVLSRFLEDSELSLLNRDPREEVPASALLRSAVHAGLWAAERTEGLVDVTVLPAVRAAGYTGSRAGLAAVPLADALAAAPPRRPAGARANPVWTSIAVLDDAAAIRRDPRVEIDLGGVGKGLAADLLADRLAGYERFVIDCGGDVRVGGSRPEQWPVEVDVQHPLTGAAVDSFQIYDGAAATSGLDARIWQREDGSFAHHLIDPATGEPAWTGLIAASAKAPTGVEAEALAKAALLSGPKGAPRFLAEHGGLVVHDNGDIQSIPGAIAAP